jgi:phage baseplate assembly protein W
MATISRKFKDISLSFVRNPVTNDIIVINDADAIKKSVINLVRTRVGERFYNRLLGSNTYNALFEQQSPDIAYKLQLEIETLLRNFEPRIRKTSVLVTYPDDTNELYVNIAYDIVGLPLPTQSIDFILQPTRI